MNVNVLSKLIETKNSCQSRHSWNLSDNIYKPFIIYEHFAKQIYNEYNLIRNEL